VSETRSINGAILCGDFSTTALWSRMGILASFTTDVGLAKIFPNMYGTVDTVDLLAAKGDIYTPLKLLPKMSTIKSIDIFMARTSGGAGVMADLKFYFNQNTTASFTKTITVADCAKGYVHYEINKPFVNSLQIETEYKTNVKLTFVEDYMPAYAIIEYEPTNTLK
jgi:hypothetical protein